MLQVSEYKPGKYFKWFWTTDDFSKVITRQQLVNTPRAKAVMSGINFGIAIEILAGLVLIVLGILNKLVGGIYFGFAVIIAYPIIWSQVIGIFVFFARILIINPDEKKKISNSKDIFSKTKAKKIAVLGSYGKTSMKELLLSVLSRSLDVVATPGNMNVAISHARFASKLTGDEDVVIIEYGEGAPGDIAKFASNTKPDIAVITGLSPAHLDEYKTLDGAAKDIFSISKFVDDKNIYINLDSKETNKYITKTQNGYSSEGALGYKVSDVNNSLSGISFTLTKGDKKIKVKSKLIGRHQIAPLSLVATLALNLGMKKEDVEKALSETTAYEHRMKPRDLNGATIIDDTYNGNLEGVRAGTKLLKEVSARRKIYVTPGLVDQGNMNKIVHNEMGELIAEAKPDIVVLMKNSVTNFIKEGLHKGEFKGQLIVEDDPLHFYNNLASFTASGDVVLMQNDWTDIYK
jgi:UDP-N-acetylmuramoyl-tripeptide--D-alanyl-D-alanine ligase